MPELPVRPDLDQLRRQARELQRAAASGDPASLRRLRAVSAASTLAAAQLAIAREHGFPGWPQLRRAVRSRGADDTSAAVPVPSQDPVASHVAQADEPVTGQVAQAQQPVTGQAAQAAEAPAAGAQAPAAGQAAQTPAAGQAAQAPAAGQPVRVLDQSAAGTPATARELTASLAPLAGHEPATGRPDDLIVAETGLPATAPQIKSWEEMRRWSADLLRARTGADVDAWTARIAQAEVADEPALRSWLIDRGVTGYAQELLVWERFGYPRFLTADADELIAGQYADRPRLRPILDAILTLLPALGQVTVQARGTYVSLVGPRRTFAYVQATTKNRVDLGLRLDSAVPAGRLLAAKNVGGAASVRVALTDPSQVDAEVANLLHRAYDENAVPARRRPPVRRRLRSLGDLTVRIDGYDLPGRSCQPEPCRDPYQNVHVAVYTQADDRPTLLMPGNPWRAAEPVPADAASARWELTVAVREDDSGLDFAGPFVRGSTDDRHLGLAWGELPGDGTLRLFRGAKLRLVDIDQALIRQALQPGRKLIASIRLTDARGNPVCARVHPPALIWSVETATAPPLTNP